MSTESREPAPGWRLETGRAGFTDEGFVCVRNVASQCGQEFYESRDPLMFSFLSALSTQTANPSDDFERGRQQGMQQERALWEMAAMSQEAERQTANPLTEGEPALSHSTERSAEAVQRPVCELLEQIDHLRANLRSVTDAYEALLDDGQFPFPRNRSQDEKDSLAAWWEDSYARVKQAREALEYPENAPQHGERGNK